MLLFTFIYSGKNISFNFLWVSFLLFLNSALSL